MLPVYVARSSGFQTDPFWANFDTLLGRNFHADLATPLMGRLLQQWPDPVGCNPGGPVMVTSGSGRPTPVDKLQIDVVHSASAIGTWTVEKEFEISTVADFLCC